MKTNLVMLNTLNIPTSRQFKKGKKSLVRYIMMYPCHALLCISDLEILFHSGSACKIKYETNHSIRDTHT